jgi:hypothetical protein
MTINKPRYKLSQWELIPVPVPMSLNVTGNAKFNYRLQGISNHYQEGRSITTSILLRIDFEGKVAETMNSIYELCDTLPEVKPRQIPAPEAEVVELELPEC